MILLLLLLAAPPDFVEIPAGSFMMGCEAASPCAQGLPRRRVEFSGPFWMANTETTVGQFREFVKATGYRTDAEKAGDARTWRAPGFKVEGAQPVVYMTMNDATAYCEWAGARLPTEAEWEYAARAGAESPHFWGEEMDDRYLWYRANTNGRPGRAGSKLPNRWGLHDVEGNAWEWVTGKPPHTSVTLEGHGSIRGGGWMTCPEPYPPEKGIRQWQIWLSVPFVNFARQNFRFDWRRDDSGFRCAK